MVTAHVFSITFLPCKSVGVTPFKNDGELEEREITLQGWLSKAFSDICVFPLLSFHPLLSQGQDSDEVNGESFQHVCCKQIQIDRHIAICILQYTLY